MEFCHECGSRVVKQPNKCHRCKSKIKEDMNFCYNCGIKVIETILRKRKVEKVKKTSSKKTISTKESDKTEKEYENIDNKSSHKVSTWSRFKDSFSKFLEENEKEETKEEEDEEFEISISNKSIVAFFLVIIILVLGYWYFSNNNSEVEVSKLFTSIPTLYHNPENNDAFISIPEEVFIREDIEKGDFIDLMIFFKEEKSDEELNSIISESTFGVDILKENQIQPGLPEKFVAETHVSLKVKKSGDKFKSELFKLKALEGGDYFVEFGKGEFPYGYYVGIQFVNARFSPRQ
jgi:hypothetical protein